MYSVSFGSTNEILFISLLLAGGGRCFTEHLTTVTNETKLFCSECKPPRASWEKKMLLFARGELEDVNLLHVMN